MSYKKLKSKHINKIIDCEESLNTAISNRKLKDRIVTLNYIIRCDVSERSTYGGILIDENHIIAAKKISKELTFILNFISIKNDCNYIDFYSNKSQEEILNLMIKYEKYNLDFSLIFKK